MARQGIARLSATKIHRVKKAGLHSDGGNLYLSVGRGENGYMRRSWIFRFKLPGPNGRQRDLGLGSLDTVGLAQARERAKQARELLSTGIDPIEHRNAERGKAAAALPIPTFDQVAQDYIATHSPSWRNALHTQQWQQSLRTYASPTIGRLPVNLVTERHIMQILEPHWLRATETMQRVRGRIERILDYARARKLRDGDNPASWAVLQHLLAKPEKVAKEAHFSAQDYKTIGAFMADLRKRGGIAALALEFAVLTCARSGEALGAIWSEINFDETVWIVPATRIKSGKEHRVPLSEAAIDVLKKAKEITTAIGGKIGKSDFVFANDRTGGQMSGQSLRAVLKRLGRDDVTPHGFRSAFRDWAAETTNYPSEVAELALAHSVGNKVEQAYRRGDMFEKRRRMMEAWANYCAAPVDARDDAKVVAIRP